MAAVMIGVDPHKGYTAVAIGSAEEPLGEVQVRACAAQADRLLAWAAAWPQRVWAVEGWPKETARRQYRPVLRRCRSTRRGTGTSTLPERRSAAGGGSIWLPRRACKRAAWSRASCSLVMCPDGSP
jgi:hypothetical protein